MFAKPAIKKVTMMIALFIWGCVSCTSSNQSVPDVSTTVSLDTATEEFTFPSTITLEVNDQPLPPSTETPSVTIPAPSPTLTSIFTDEARETTETPVNSERIYGWVAPWYGYLEATVCCQEFMTIVSGSPSGIDLTTIQPLYELRTVSFAPGENKLALVHTLNSEPMMIVTNLQMDERIFEWVDSASLMGELGEKNRSVRLSWGPGNQYLLFEIWDDFSVKIIQRGVISILENRAFTLADRCGYMQIVNELEYSIICPLIADDATYLVLNDNGTTETIYTLPDSSFPVRHWAVSMQKDRIVWADEDGELRVRNRDHSESSLPIHIEDGRTDLDMNVVQLSNDGTKLLVFAQNIGGDYCGSTSACWIVFDLVNSMTIWESGEGTDWPAAFSPDGSSVVYFFSGYDSNGLYQTFGMTHQFPDNKEHLISTMVFSAVTWQK